MHDCRVLTHHSAATAQPRAEAGRRPGHWCRSRVLPRWRVLGNGSLRPSLLFWLTAQALPWVAFCSSSSTCAMTSQWQRSLTPRYTPQTYSSLCPHWLIFMSTGASSPAFLHGAQSIAHLLSLPLPPWPFKMFSSSFLRCDKEAVQQHLDGSNPKGTPNPSSRALSRPQGHSSPSCSG